MDSTSRDQEEIQNGLPTLSDAEPFPHPGFSAASARKHAHVYTPSVPVSRSSCCAEGRGSRSAMRWTRLVVGVGACPTKVGSLSECNTVETKPAVPMSELINNLAGWTKCTSTRTSHRPAVGRRRAATGTPPRDCRRADDPGVLVLLGAHFGRRRPLHVVHCLDSVGASAATASPRASNSKVAQRHTGHGLRLAPSRGWVRHWKRWACGSGWRW